MSLARLKAANQLISSPNSTIAQGRAAAHKLFKKSSDLDELSAKVGASCMGKLIWKNVRKIW